VTTAGEHHTLIELLLDEIEATAGPVAWPRVEALVTALIELYGEALERLVAHARGAASDPAMLDADLSRDELLKSLLALRDVAPFGDLVSDDAFDEEGASDGSF
jgi:hypothetical protein